MDTYDLPEAAERSGVAVVYSLSPDGLQLSSRAETFKRSALPQNGGPTATHVPATDSPARGKGTGCPPTDQRGMPRQTSCTLGAIE